MRHLDPELLLVLGSGHVLCFLTVLGTITEDEVKEDPFSDEEPDSYNNENKVDKIIYVTGIS